MKKNLQIVALILFSHCVAEAQWEKTSFPASDLSYSTFYINGHNLFVSLDGFVSFYRSTDDGSTWENIYDSLPKEKRVESIINSGEYLLGCMSDWNPDSTVGKFYRSTDNGNTWQITTGNGKNIGIVYALADFNTFLLGAYGQNSIVLSSDNGNNWISIVDTLAGSGVTKFLLNRDYLYAAENNGGGVYRSKDNGKTWQVFNNEISYTDISDLNNLGGKLFASALHGLWYSTDNAQHWTNFSNTIRIISLAKSDSLIFASGDKIYFSNDTGQIWHDITGNLPMNISFIGTNEKYLFAGSNQTIWRRPLSDFTSEVKQPNSNINKLFLEANHPNPFSRITTLSYITSDYGAVKLYLFDELGREVARIIDGEQEKGSHIIDFDGSKLPAGNYIVRLENSGGVVSRKVIIER